MALSLKEELDLALEVCYEAHRCQVDKGGNPYILHPLRISYKALKLGLQFAIVGLLHDVVEDTDKTFQDLLDLGFSNKTVNSLKLLCHEKSVDYFTYISGIKLSGDEVAIQVKLLDLEDNSNINRIKNPTDKDFKRLDKYNKAKTILEE